MKNWSLSQLLEGLHTDIHHQLETSRASFGHPGTKGDASERVWLELLGKYLPQRYQASKAHVVDSNGKFSDQIDVVVFDRQYSPFIFHFQEQIIVPAESVYAVFETKQAVNATEVVYAQKKVESVRALHRTSLPIPYAGGTYPPKPLFHILGGILSFESDWSPKLGKPFFDVLKSGPEDGRLDYGCVAAHGFVNLNKESGEYESHLNGKAATGFLFSLISQLQFSGTVPMIDIQAYAKWLDVR